MEINNNVPNCGVPERLLHEHIILCCGEDCGELLAAVARGTGMPSRSPDHDYRCYRFWREKNFTLIWSGIGTGCLEAPLTMLRSLASRGFTARQSWKTALPLPWNCFPVLNSCYGIVCSMGWVTGVGRPVQIGLKRINPFPPGRSRVFRFQGKPR